VSYELEALFPDALCQQLEAAAQTYMLSEIPQDFISELLITMNLRAKGGGDALSTGWQPPAWLKDVRFSGGGGVTAKGYGRTLGDSQAAVRELSTTSLADFEPATTPEETARRYLRSLQLGLGDPQLPFLTEGSQVFRIIVPRSEAQQLRVSRFYEQAMPSEMIRVDGWGLMLFPHSAP